jgi:hypothetical protein
MPPDEALVAAEALNPSMASCILDLYRSATKVQDAARLRRHREAGHGHRAEETHSSTARAQAIGKKAGARVTDLSGPAIGGCSKTPSVVPRCSRVLEEPRRQSGRGGREHRARPQGESDCGLEARRRSATPPATTPRCRWRRSPASDDLTDRIGLPHRRERGRAHIRLDHRDDPGGVERVLQRPASLVEQEADRREEKATGETEDGETDDLHGHQ